MRPYAPYDRNLQSSQAGKKKERKTRTHTEWDIRIDADKDYADRIVKRLEESTGSATYVLVSGVEQPDNASTNWGSKELHVHVCLVSGCELRRDQALALIRGPTPESQEYAVPRNNKFTYAGWYMHHTKIDWKLVSEPAIRFEYGQLPVDICDPDVKKKVQTMFKKFGSDSTASEEANKTKFWMYLE